MRWRKAADQGGAPERAAALDRGGRAGAGGEDADAEAGEQLILELRQVRSEVDFLRSQVETGGGVADVRFNDLQRRIDKVLQDAAALATQASTAQRQAETAVQRVDELEGQMAVMQATR